MFGRDMESPVSSVFKADHGNYIHEPSDGDVVLYQPKGKRKFVTLGHGNFNTARALAVKHHDGILNPKTPRDLSKPPWKRASVNVGGKRVTRLATYDRTNPDTLKWVKGFFSRHSKLRRFASIPVVHVEEPNRRRHPEASYTSKGIELYPKFRQLSPGVQDFVFAHEIGHAVLEKWGNREFMSAAKVAGVDPWDTPNLPFAQHNFDEAFADSFASYHVDGDVQRRYPEWSSLVSVSLSAVRGASMRVATKTPAEKGLDALGKVRSPNTPFFSPGIAPLDREWLEKAFAKQIGKGSVFYTTVFGQSTMYAVFSVE